MALNYNTWNGPELHVHVASYLQSGFLELPLRHAKANIIILVCMYSVNEGNGPSQTSKQPIPFMRVLSCVLCVHVIGPLYMYMYG